MNILIIEPYYTGSHKAWVDGYTRYSEHQVEILSLKGQFWKWRMHGGAITIAKKFMTFRNMPDLILATDMLDLTTFLALTRGKTAQIPTGLYFHESQLSYPWSPEDRDVAQRRDRHYGFINYASALAADSVFFNSAYHRDVFLEELPRLLKHFPDHQELANVKKIAEKSRVLCLGLDLERLDRHVPKDDSSGRCKKNIEPLLLWNHRWEHDKNPHEFFKALYAISDQGLDFQVAILGENFSQRPDEFEIARRRLGDRIVQYGYSKNFADYVACLFRADILPVTSRHDFFGMSVVEAVYCGCYPLLPKRLSYPEIFPVKNHPGNYYANFEELVEKLAHAIRNIANIRRLSLASAVDKYSWQKMAPLYDKELEDIADKKKSLHGRG